MSHFNISRINWTIEHLSGLSNVLQSLAPSLEGTYSTQKLVTNRFSVSQFMQACIEFDDMAPIGIVTTGEDYLALCYDHEQEHPSSNHKEKLHAALVAITQAFGQYRGELEKEKLLTSLPSSTHINVVVH